MAQKKPEYVSMIDSGDIILVVKTKERIRVSSSVLCNASSVFRAMLNSEFLEGQGERSTENPKEITLPDDSGRAMVDLCRMLHFHGKVELSEWCFLSTSILDIAVLADKYDCTSAVRLATETLFRRITPYDLHFYSQHGPECVQELLEAAILLKQPRLFALYTRHYISAQYGGLRETGYDLGAIPTALAKTINKLKDTALRAMKTIAADISTDEVAECRACGESIKAGDIYEHAIEAMGPYKATLTVHETLKNVAFAMKFVRCTSCGSSDVKASVFCSLLHLIEGVDKLVAGLCFMCFSDGKPQNECPHKYKVRSWNNRAMLY